MKVGFLARGLCLQKVLGPSRGEQDSQLGFQIVLVSKTFGQINVKQGH